MKETYTIEGREVTFKATAATVRNYRDRYGRDFLTDMVLLENGIVKDKKADAEAMRIVENMVYIMAYDADNQIPPIDEWLDSFSPYFAYRAIPKIINMWAKNRATLAESKKN